MCHKITLASDTLIDFQIKFHISIGETVTYWFTLIALSALRRFDNENMLSLMNLILMSILTDLQVTPTKPRQMTKPYSSYHFIANCFNARNYKMEVKVDPYGFAGYSNQTQTNNKSIFVLRFIANCFNAGYLKMDVKVTLTKNERMTKPYSSPRFISNCFNAGYLKMDVKRGSVKVKELQERCIFKAFQVIKSRKLATKRSLQQTDISQDSGSGVDEGTGIIPGVPDVPTEESDEEISRKSSDEDDDDEVDDRSDDQEEDDDQDDNDDDQDIDNDCDDFTPENSNDKGNDDASLGMNVGSKEGQDAEDDNEELYRDININLEVVPLTLTAPNLPPQTIPTISQFVGAIYSIPGIVERYMDQRLNEVVKVAVQIQSYRLQDEPQAKNEEFLNKLDENIQKIIKEQVKEQVKECDKIILDTYGDTVTLKRHRDDANKDEEPSVGSDWGSKRRREGKEPKSTSALKEKASKTTGKSTEGSKSHQKTQADSRSLFNELMDTYADFSAFLMNRLKLDTLIPELLAGPTYELMKGSCKSLAELELFLEEVYKATTNQLDWNNPKGQQYPHNLLKPLPLIPNSRGHRVIPFDHFINNDLEYLRGSASSHKYTIFVTKTKAVDYGHIKWIEDLFYGFTVNRESARDVYSKHRIIAITELQIVKWHNYKHLDWITVHRDDNKLYKFKEGDFKRFRIQDIEDLLLLLVQGKLTNLTVKERFAFNVSLRMFMRSIVIQRRVEDLQLAVESYQKKLNLTKSDTYRFDLKRKEAYTAYSNPRGFIYQNKDKQNRLIRIDELHKFNDGMLNDV
nr:hypothetical protein [Tanacetum cinerariifolium]